MGCHANIRHDKFPKQRSDIGYRRVVVCFHYDTEQELLATVVRDDDEEPFVMILLLDDGRYVLATECQWRPIPRGTLLHGC